MDIIKLLQNKPDLSDLFTRKEEYQYQLRDQYDRFPYYLSKNRDIFNPVVSKYLFENGYHIEYPDNKQFAICLTHDIDFVYETKVTKGIESLRQIQKAKLAGCMHSLASDAFEETTLVEFFRDYGSRKSVWGKKQFLLYGAGYE